jgi:Tol biopolymer transport system component
MFCVGANGTLVYLPGGSLPERRTLALIELDGSIKPLALDNLAISTGLQVAADGRRIVFTATNAHGIDEIWVRDVGEPSPRRLVVYPDADCTAPALSADGEQVAFRRGGLDERNGIYVVRVDGGDEPRRVWRSPARPDTTHMPSSWSPDGRELLLRERTNGPWNLAVLRVGEHANGAALRRLLPGYPIVSGGRFSPDGRRITFTSNRHGPQQVYECSYDPGKGAGEPAPVARAGAFLSRFTLDGRALVYRDSTWIARQLLHAPDAAAERLYELAAVAGRIHNFDLLADGRAVVALVDISERRVEHLNVVLGWASEVGASLGTPSKRSP